MKTISRYIMTLALLITAVGGAWAQKQITITQGFEDGMGDWTMNHCHSSTGISSAYGGYEGSNSFRFYNTANYPQYLISPELDENDGGTMSFYYARYSSNYPETFKVGYSTTTSEPSAFTWGDEVTSTNIYGDYLEYTYDFPAGTKYVSIACTSNDQFYFFVDAITIEYAPAEAPTDVEVTTNAAQAGDPFTEATFNMPAFDATAEYELVRDMSVQMPVTVGDGEDGYRIRVKKAEEGDGYEPADFTSLDQMKALINVYDAIDQKSLTPGQDFYVKFYQIDEQTSKPIGDGVELADFDFAPGLYAVTAVGQDDSDYGGETILSNIFRIYTKVDLTFNPVPNGNLTVVVDETDMTNDIDENGMLKDIDSGQSLTMTPAEGYKLGTVIVGSGDGVMASDYTGSETWYGTSSSTLFYWAVQFDPASLTTNALSGIRMMIRSDNVGEPVTLSIYSDGETPQSGTLLYSQEMNFTAGNTFETHLLDQDVVFDKTKPLWLVLSQYGIYHAYCHRYPVNPNAKIWTYNTNTSDPQWTSNGNYTPSVYAIFSMPTAEDGSVTFTVPGKSDIVSYKMLRDMSVQMPVTVGDGEDGYRIRVKKNAQEKFEPADMSLQDMFALYTVHDDIENKDLVFYGQTVDCDLSIYAVDDNDQPIGDAITDFSTLVPGRYVAMATAANGSDYYDGETGYSNIFVLYQGYEVTVPAGEFITYFKDEALYVEDDDVQLFTITEVSETTATATELSIAPANTAILVKNNSADEKTFLLIPTLDQADNVEAYEGFIGTLVDATIAASTEGTTNYALNGRAFVFVKNDIAIAANKAWLSISNSNARTITLVFDETTKITNTNLTNLTNGDWYDLNGRKLNGMPTKKGVYINNGRKVVVK